MFKESYVVDESGNRIGVLLDLHTYQKLLAAAREVEILRAATTQVNHNLAEEPISAENDLEKFIGVWADFTQEEDAVFGQIYEERPNYFRRSLLDLE
jgi:hypothetical protein